ncbi:sugar ABC transporter ATP-binding protein [Nocardioides zeae]|uniref:Sugar ABC transporter ATP-binding protein n=1 Tax=Nocardioides imazamoxiresistens TaxID=3231893 RepID=A0ABU3PR28_9ACTN|nr:sugar ABC transporter ATP-binding protein [Nocardioides zeae]MDT9591667.1 sugar ABC transporter ATP-binding protein [Nocardioides zeae]
MTPTTPPARGADPADAPVALRLRGLTKTFGAARVLRGVDLDVRAGEVHAFIGANGSGKSTTIKVLAGYHDADEARCEVAGEEVPLTSRAAKRHDGLRFVHQDLGQVPELSAVDNIALAHGYRRNRLGGIDWRAQRELTRRALERFGTRVDIDLPLATHSAVVRTELAISAAMHGWEPGSGVLVLDEPTAMLPPAQVERLFDVVRSVRDSGAAVLYVSHRLDEIFALADRVSVIRAGAVVATYDVADVTADELADVMVGEQGAAVRDVQKAATASEEVVLRATGLTGRTMRGIDLELRRGEVLGVAGLVGSGSEEVPYAVAGRLTGPHGGTVVLTDGGRAADIPLVPGNRIAEGVFLEASVAENLTVSSLSTVRRGPRLSARRERSVVRDWIQRLGISAPGADAPISTLSGGNQQKVVLARCLNRSPRILAMSEPTAGVDIATRARIYDLVAREAAAGLSVVVTSSDPQDLVALCSRVLVVRDGRVVAELVGDEVTETVIVRAIEGIRAA